MCFSECTDVSRRLGLCVCFCLCVSSACLFFLLCVPSRTHAPLCLREHHQSEPPRRSTQLHTQAFKKTPSNPASASPKVNTAYSLWHLPEGEDYNGVYEAGIGCIL